MLAQRDLAQSLLESGRRRYLDGFTRDAVVDRYLAFFEEIAR